MFATRHSRRFLSAVPSASNLPPSPPETRLSERRRRERPRPLRPSHAHFLHLPLEVMAHGAALARASGGEGGRLYFKAFFQNGILSLKPQKARGKIVTAHRRHYFGLSRRRLVSGIPHNTNEAGGTCVTGLWGWLMPLGSWSPLALQRCSGSAPEEI